MGPMRLTVFSPLADISPENLDNSSSERGEVGFSPRMQMSFSSISNRYVNHNSGLQTGENGCHATNGF